MIVILIKTDDNSDYLYQKILSLCKEQHDIELSLIDYEINVLSFPGLTIYVDQRKVIRDDNQIYLSHLEFETLLYLANQPNRVFSHSQIFDSVWKESSDSYHHVIVNTIYQLRKKIELDPTNPIYIQTIVGTGYKFTIPDIIK